MKYGTPDDEAFLFPSHSIADRCAAFIEAQVLKPEIRDSTRIIDLCPDLDLSHNKAEGPEQWSIISAVLIPKVHANVAKAFWQHSGDGISSRRADYCFKAFAHGRLVMHGDSVGRDEGPILLKGPRRYQRAPPVGVKTAPLVEQSDGRDCARFVEERFGRNLDLTLAVSAKQAIRRRIAGALATSLDVPESISYRTFMQRTKCSKEFSEADVYLYPCGMSSIFNTHQLLMKCKGPLRSISYGFPYIDTLKILQKWGPGCQFYGHGAAVDLDDIAERCNRGEQFLALFCEFPGNPLLRTPDLLRIRKLADRYDFAVVVDETIGNFINVDIFPYADIVVSSLTKVFAGECNVMGGSAIINPQGKYYGRLKKIMEFEYEDNYWPEDAIFMERNSRDFVSRIQRINVSAEAICETLKASPIVEEVFYPKCSPTRHHYDTCRNKDGGYGGLLSVTFKTTVQAITFFDELDTAKGPSLGTNFTLSSPYVILAHYAELEWVQQFGVDPDLVRISIGLEDPVALCDKVRLALDAASKAA